ncbi:1-deoxy-D-xylulose-5-phosphate reductoisomerase [Lysinibacillus sp. FSL M8-0216]|uniref:1-deoxy-D-xylulose 5-phosphate reductoisomerase n=1 Tax=Lysinibacillus fusiformis TaxID=28031 RepID=A0A1H9D3Z2_9BACI|nr:MULTISPECIES: 1-deoxy-D-xylulose-5-phosphate reductoisomerase [Lysinibacillus]HAU35926.1 1-deoxy-D-xylulose-5-phosphate reductoisomerase [Lysinibacillus sp.]MCG7434255.1 1-deoxy-D-xylulose-5-phosphate reductoisomerase [Lysinibacillus fusiformis]MED4668691.1 1-deoxy-D-xylulose-5-phosphate reductoisomerase [Lysinibacillus fusiformis]QAS59071.1 1-deoxy-D-xylulose-5-phosphate reductoisomerase [Lysinibacillus sphaericus]RDV28453.1 1-deoxy-D-xylulose-5-phosphate reductoisomerase [Lysinibacillus f
MKKISLLGATGSIGWQTYDILKEQREAFQLVAFSSGKNIKKTREMIDNLKPELVSVQLEEDALLLAKEYPTIHFTFGAKGLVEVATHPDSTILVNAVLGSVGLESTLAAIRMGKTIAIANKETLVTAGHLVMAEAKKYNATILPVDSEHSAIFQSMNGEDPKYIERLIITASGGSFRDKTRDQLKHVTVADALNHPNWSMGAKITIDSATMMNKGLEVIEAHVLFDMPYEKIDVLLHRESIIHSLVEYHDTSVIAQLGTPDMRVPIQYALSYPDRIPLHNGQRLNLAQIGQLHFQEMDFERYPALRLAYEAGRTGGTILTAMNAANEAAVAAFLQGKITFLQIDETIERVMQAHQNIAIPDLQTILQVDSETRKIVLDMVK